MHCRKPINLERQLLEFGHDAGQGLFTYCHAANRLGWQRFASAEQESFGS
jgi:hypothetical protein